MSFLSSVTLPNQTKPLGTAKKTGFLGGITYATPQTIQESDLRKQVIEAEREAVRAGSLGGLVKGTAQDIFGKISGGVQGLIEAWKQTPAKIAEDIRASAEDIQQGKVLKGIAKAGFRTAGDAALAIFAPIGAAIGIALELTGGQKLIDKAGTEIANRSGITDLPAFQKFAIEHPNAGEDFNRLLMLVLSKGEKGKIDPIRLARETKLFANKLVSSEVAKPAISEGFLKNVEIPGKPKEEILPIEKPVVEFKPTEPLAQEAGKIAEVKPIEVKPQEISVPREQLPVGEGAIKVSRLEARITESLGKINPAEIEKLGLTTYREMNKPETIRLASEYVIKNPENGLKVLKGEIESPPGLPKNAIYVAMENLALGDAVLGRKLATLQATRLGQELSILTELNPESPVRVMQDIVRVREATIQKQTGKKQSQVQKETINEIKTEIKKTASKRPTWEEFINEIKCNY